MADENTSTTGQAEQTSETGEQSAAGSETGAQKSEAPPQRRTPEVPPEVERALRKANKEAETLRLKLKEFEDRDKSEAEKLADRATAAETEAQKAQTKLMRYEVAAAKKLPSEWAARLQGSSKEELEADADQLLEALGPQQRQAPSFDGGVRQGASAPTDMNALIRQQAGRA